MKKLRRPPAIDHRGTISRYELAPRTSVSFDEAKRRPKLMEIYKIEWKAGQRRLGWLLALPALGAGWLTWMLMGDADFQINTPLFLKIALAAPAFGLGITAALSIFWPMSLFAMSHPAPRVNRKAAK
ncbi:MAG: hypothetical protein AB8B85_08340 [Paracoccaceae bacterium]